MVASVTSIGSKIATLGDVVELFRRGRSTEALVALRRYDSVGAATLRARVLLRMSRVDEARAECLRYASDEISLDMVAELLLVRASIELRAGEFAYAHDLLDEARVFVVSSASGALEAEMLYLEARIAYEFADFALCEERLNTLHHVCEPFDLPERNTPVVSIRTTRARALELHGFLRARCGDVMGQMSLLAEALTTISGDSRADAFIEASIAANFAYCAREVDPSAHRLASAIAALERIERIGELAPFRFQVLRSLGWIAAVQGDHLTALRFFREAGKVSSDPEHTLYTHVDRAYLARELGQELFAQEEIAEANVACSAMDWNNPPGVSYVLPVMLAQLVAPDDPIRAQELLDLYTVARKNTPAIFVNEAGPRMEAMELFAMAKICLAREDVAGAIERLERARSLWTVGGCAWRAGLAAAELAKLGAGEKYESLARAEVTIRPHSFFSKNVASSVRMEIAS